MLSYRHAFHAGNFADVHKHGVVALILEALRRKDAPFFVIDTHAGAGVYDLAGPQAQKLEEYREGIARLWPHEQAGALPDLYRETLVALNPNRRLGHYPGSPALIRQGLRASDRAVFVELHKTDLSLLDTWATKDRRIRVQHKDGFEALLASVPPKERRGLVLVDPPYEVKTDYAEAADTLIRAHRKWATGIYALWYPLLPEGRDRSLLNALETSGIRRILVTELQIRPAAGALGMFGSGVAVINPPWKLDSELETLMPRWAQLLGPDTASWKVQWRVPE